MDSPVLSKREFYLVSTDAAGVAHPLPAELGPLRLYQDDDGFYSVLGPPLIHTTLGGGQANEPTGTNSVDTLAYDRVNISATITPPKGVASGPHTCSRRSFTCNAPDCLRFDPFKTKQALNRHYEVIHLAERRDCPVPGCENVGEKGIKRTDNLIAHLKNQHGALPAGGSHGDWLIPKAVEHIIGNHAL
ncbi:hypothetical protein HOY80DRAFT_999728 [Tuber brumale]|nr:hypothetical protein HOY80DRAFT_999728 [Tuber brumale]